MSSACPACHRRNPAVARYCHFDGVALPGSHASAPIAIGSKPFLAPFVFPSGRTCRCFDELVQGCEVEWDDAREMLRQGFFEGFLGGLGRADLAGAARRAARAGDPDLGLDEFLSRLPGERTPPALGMSPREVNLGGMRRDEVRMFPLRIENRGMGLLTGTVRSEVPWLTLGEAPGAPEKLIHCRGDMLLPVQVRGAGVRAGTKPQEGRIVAEAGTQSVTVVVRVLVAVVPFAEGVLAGAYSPRQLAEKARAHPREAAALFESGAVPLWYESNGWTYPVQGPAASGMAAVQQYFEALGLTRPPKVQISQTAVDLVGAPGGSVEYFLFVESPENRPVYARAVSETDWLEFGRSRTQGASVRLHMRVPRVPASPGQCLNGRAVVVSNGNQRFVVEVRLHVQGVVAAAAAPPPVRRAGAEPAVEPAPVARVVELQPVPAPAAAVVRVVELPSVPEPAPPMVIPAKEVVPPPPPPPPTPAAPITVVAGPRARTQAKKSAPTTEVKVDDEPAPRRRGILFHLMPLALVLLVLGGAVVHDLLLPKVGAEGDDEDTSSSGAPVVIDPTPLVVLRFHDGGNPDDFQTAERTMSFGLSVRDRDGHEGRNKRLMYDNWGRTNNVCIRVDGQDFLFGQNDLVFPRPEAEAVRVIGGVARWVELRGALGTDATGRTRDGVRSVWRIEGHPDRRCNVVVTQTAEIVPGEQSGRLDTCLVRYTIHNRDDRAREVGLRFLLDTFIGDNDGVPFTIPGQPGLCSTQRRFDSPKEVPDYIQALEKDSLLKPGTVAHLQFRVGNLEAPSQVLLGGYPDQPLRQLGYRQANGWYTPWNVPLVSIRAMVEARDRLTNAPRDPVPDSAVTLFWGVKQLGPGAKREVGFSYGLGKVASAEGAGKLLLTVGGRTVRGGEFSVTALRASPADGERLTLNLRSDSGLELVSPAEQPVPPVARGAARPISTVTWRLRAKRSGRFEVLVESSAGVRQKETVRIHAPRSGVLD